MLCLRYTMRQNSKARELTVYSDCSFQVAYRRKIFEKIALAAYSGVNSELFRQLPNSIVAAMGFSVSSSEFSSDLDYVAESCCAALGLEPMSFKGLFSREWKSCSAEPFLLDVSRGPVLCALKSVCHKCANSMGSERPCAKVCPHAAIQTDAFGHTQIDGEHCDSCGKCMLACPYGAILDKSSIYQTIQAIHGGEHIYALLLPGLSLQFSKHFSQLELTEAFRLLGFYDILELEAAEPDQNKAGAGLCMGWRSKEGKSHISCCVDSIPDYLFAIQEEISFVKSYDPGAMFILAVPCAVSKVEAYRLKPSMDVSFVLDFEELAGMMDARCLDHDLIRPCELEPLKHFS